MSVTTETLGKWLKAHLPISGSKSSSQTSQLTPDLGVLSIFLGCLTDPQFQSKAEFRGFFLQLLFLPQPSHLIKTTTSLSESSLVLFSTSWPACE